MDSLDHSLAALARYPQFILYRKLGKYPLNYTSLQKSDPLNPINWVESATAVALAEEAGNEYGVGFVLTESDPFFCIDIDNCISENGTWSSVATELLTQLNGAAFEISLSGKGVHIFGISEPMPHLCKNEKLGIELYTEKRFIALTGNHAIGNAEKNCTDALAQIIERYFKICTESAPAIMQQTLLDNNEIINLALSSKSARVALGISASFEQLWNADAEALGKFYPSSKGDAFNRSSADAALAQHLAYFTGKDFNKIKELMLESKLVRHKWERPDYLARTINGAIARTTQVFNAAANHPQQIAITAQRPSRGVLNQLMQQQLFTGCVYVLDEHKILTPEGNLLNNERFRVEYGGYTFVLDAGNAKTTRNAWEAFTESQLMEWPRAHSTCFKPGLPSGEITDCDGRRLVNAWVPLKTQRIKGDPKPFLDHIATLIPNERDRTILISYAAALVQHQGIKFQWCPLIQGVDGNGKTLLTDCIEFAIGTRYCVRPLANKIAARFNEWIYGTVFAGIEDVYVPGERNEVIEILKPMITARRYEIEERFKNNKTVDVCCNFILNSNHQDALHKTRNDRRFAPFFCAQQDEADLKRDGLSTEYFTKLYNWLEKQDGYAIVSDFLWSYSILDEFNPAFGGRAPITQTTLTAIESSRTPLQQEIIDAVQSHQLGFRGDWVSSYHLGIILKMFGAHRWLNGYRCQKLLNELGYIMHPALKDGRATQLIPMDGGMRSRLYIKKDSAALSLTTGAAVVEAYITAQNAI